MRDRSKPIVVSSTPTDQTPSPDPAAPYDPIAELHELAARLRQQSGDSVTMSKAKRTGYRGTIGALVLAVIGVGTTAVRAYGDSREASARAAIAAESEEAAAAEYAEETRRIAEQAATHAREIDRKLDEVVATLKRIERRDER